MKPTAAVTARKKSRATVSPGQDEKQQLSRKAIPASAIFVASGSDD